MDKATKIQQVAELKQLVEAIPSVVLTEYCGLSVEQMTEMRNALRQLGVTYRVVKNTLIKLAIEGTTLAGLAEHFTGPVGIAYPTDDNAAAPAKAVLEQAKKLEAFNVIAGWAEGEVLDADGVKALSTMPTKDEMRAKLLSLFNTPAQRFLSVLEAGPRDFLGVLNARKRQLEEGGDKEAA